MSAEARRLVPIPDARVALGGIGHTTIYDLIGRGRLNKVNIGRRSFVTSESIDAFIDELSNNAESSSPAGEDAAHGPPTPLGESRSGGSTAPRAPSPSRSHVIAQKLAGMD
jgi:hypothetical protein